VEDRAGRGRERLGELRLPGAGRPVEEQPLRRLDAPLSVEIRLGEGERESLEDGLGLAEPADLVEGDRRLDLRLDAAGEVAVLLTQLAEAVLQPPLPRPLLLGSLGLGHGVRSTGVSAPRWCRPSRRPAPRRAPAPSRGSRARWHPTGARPAGTRAHPRS